MTLSKHLSIFSLFALITVFSVGCNDDDDATPAADTTAPVITITSPEDGAIIDIPGTITVAGTIEEEGELERIEVNISSAVLPTPFNRTIMKGEDGFPTKSGNIYSVNITEDIQENTPLPITFTIDVEAEDNAGNIGTERISVILR
ncbi:Ig-like domain-containing protein [Cesiribacter sp. SM1]|uniref:Ig-like domain-containing protein n=1 Tax=Cesiribacter sp. SM1 TaxID=2861196 RepID=UPI001CD5A58B|nr:Ig-like domain-containing protein [Cesiribacter sp. SM1]